MTCQLEYGPKKRRVCKGHQKENLGAETACVAEARGAQIEPSPPDSRCSRLTFHVVQESRSRSVLRVLGKRPPQGSSCNPLENSCCQDQDGWGLGLG